MDEEKSIKVYAKARLEVCTCKFGAYPQIQGITNYNGSLEQVILLLFV